MSEMDRLPMPSDVKGARPGGAGADPVLADAPVVEPPSVKLVVRLFLIPMFIVAAAVGVMFLIGRLAGGTPSTDEILARLRKPGGERTADLLIGPGSKQRYLDAKALVDTMKRPEGMTPQERVNLSSDLIDILTNYTKGNEGEVRHFLLLALGRTWQPNPSQPGDATPETTAARQRAVETLLRYAQSPNVADRKAAVLATVYLAGHDEARLAIPVLVRKVADDGEDLDVRLAAATALGPLATPQDQGAVRALEAGTRDAEPRNSELVWASALSLAQLGQRDVEPTILKLLDRAELAQFRYYDRETEPQNPAFRPLSEQEQERYLINTMEGSKKLDSSRVREQVAKLAEGDPSARVRYAAREWLQARQAGHGSTAPRRWRRRRPRGRGEGVPRRGHRAILR